ncbi:hypothetical protein J4Q44_G00204650 [Coregonus suidteri]|uniref:Uncharacterized protein n=1 Tax=Coregonus suidteri TaxID=861788 RepID=A0AAN8LBY7_9TELE
MNFEHGSLLSFNQLQVGTGCLKTQKYLGKFSRQDCSRTLVRVARSDLAAQSSTCVWPEESPAQSPAQLLLPQKGSIVACPVRLWRSTVESRRFSTPMLLTGNYTLTRMGVRQLSCEKSLYDSQDFQDSCRDTLGETSVHLDGGTFWSSQASPYTGKSQRAVFEESGTHL